MRSAVTVRLDSKVVEKLEYQASQMRLTRQAYIERVLKEHTSLVTVPKDNKFKSYVAPEVMAKILEKESEMAHGEEITLKELVGSKTWSEFDDVTRRNFGKEFKVLVSEGDAGALSIGRKKSNNEQTYVKK